MAAETLAEYVSALRAAAVRFLLAALLCLPVMGWRRLKLPRGRALAVVLLLSVAMVALPSALLRWVQPQLPSATVAVLFAAMPLLLVLGTPGAPRAALQASIIAVGAIALTVGSSFSVAQVGPAAVVLGVVAAVGASSLAVRRELSREHPVVVTALLLGTAGLLLFFASMALERGQPQEWSREAIVAVVFLAAVAGAPAYALYLWLLQRMEGYQAVTVQWIQPVVAVLESAFFLRLRPSFSMIAGSVIAVSCLLVVMRARPEDDDPVSLLGN